MSFFTYLESIADRYFVELGETSMKNENVSHESVPICTTAFFAFVDPAETLGNFAGWWSQTDAPLKLSLSTNSMTYVAVEDQKVPQMCSKNQTPCVDYKPIYIRRDIIEEHRFVAADQQIARLAGTN